MTDLDLAVCERWVALGLARLQALASTIDALNVFPVPDGDTGTNVLLTFRRAARQAQPSLGERDLADLTLALARGALLGARGNSGIITAQFLAGCAQEFDRCRTDEALLAVTGEQFARALTRADSQAWKAVAAPVEGTVLSVSRAAAAGAVHALPADADVVIAAAATAARSALASTPDQLPALTGVVDAGGAAFVVLLDALAAAVTEEPVQALPGVDDVAASLVAPHFRHDGPAYEVMFELTPSDGVAVSALQAALSRCGDSVAVVSVDIGSDDRLWQAHVHSDDPAQVLRVGEGFGQLAAPRVVHLASGTPRPVPSLAPACSVGCVAWVSSGGLATLLAEHGIVAVLGDEARRVSTEEVVSAAEATGAAEVLLLPNDRDSFAMMRAAAAVCAERGIHAEVVESAAEPAGLAAASVFDPAASLPNNLQAMSEAACGVRAFTIAVATRAVETDVGACRPGQIVAIEDGVIVAVADEVSSVAATVVDALTVRPERVTVLLGSGVAPGAPDQVRSTLTALLSGIEVHEIDAGQGAIGLQLGFE